MTQPTNIDKLIKAAREKAGNKKGVYNIKSKKSYIVYDTTLDEIVTSTYLQAKQEGVTEYTSDGYHTFKELYEFRKGYNAALFNEWYKQGKYSVHKSTKHSDGEDCFGGGWFIVVATLPTGDISNHYELKDWDLFDCETRELAKEWDGHTSENVLQRLQSLKQTKGDNGEKM